MRAAGLVVHAALEKMRAAVAPGVSTADLDAIAEDVDPRAGAVPSFKGYHGFPASHLLVGERADRARDPVAHRRSSPRAT